MNEFCAIIRCYFHCYFIGTAGAAECGLQINLNQHSG